MPTPLVSVVVPAYNCETTIEKTLTAILAQKRSFSHDFEVLLVDDGSKDQTSAIVQKFDDVKYIYQNNAGPAAARNLGAQESSGEYVLFTDSDCVPEECWMKKVLECFRSPDIGVVAGSYGIANEDSLLASCIQKEIIYRHTHLMPDYPKAFGSYNVCIRRDLFVKVGGFDIRYRQASGEDNDLSYRILNAGYRIYFARDAKVKHHHTDKLAKYFKEQYRHGFWRVKMYLDHPRMAHGDDYTFWKDIVEVPLVYLTLVCTGLLYFQHPLVYSVLFFFIGALFFVQIIYGFLMMRSAGPAIYYSWVMLVRSFVRSFGFFSGLVSIPYNHNKKYK